MEGHQITPFQHPCKTLITNRTNYKIMKRLGISLISGVIFLALTISATVIVYEAGVPVVKRMQAASVIDKMQGTFSELDKIIRQVASEGPGSKRTVYLSIETGQLIINKSQDSIYWTFSTDAPVLSPRTSRQYGNIVIGSNMETRAYEGSYTIRSPAVPAYIMENEHLVVYVRKVGSPTSFASYNTSDLVLGIYHKDLDEWLNNEGFLQVLLDDNPSSGLGTGYMIAEKLGENLPYATVAAYMNSSYATYWINLTLESGADFIEIGVDV